MALEQAMKEKSPQLHAEYLRHWEMLQTKDDSGVQAAIP